VEELGKPPDTACQHLGGKGCAIYNDRPVGCREFLCMWRLGLVPAEFRPDRLGVVLSIEKEPELMGDSVYVAAREVVDGGFVNADGLLSQLALKQVVLLFRGAEAMKVLGEHATAEGVRQRLGLP
jgi:hypothetical protein